MTWPDFYLICFITGCALSVLSFLGGTFHLHLPGGLHHHLYFGGRHGLGRHGFSHGGRPNSQVSPFNLPTIMAFLAWFGGAGYLASNLYGLGVLIVFGISCLSGLAGGFITFWFFAKVLMGRDHSLKESDYRLTGVLATVNSAIREGRTGEIVYSHGGARKAIGARSEDGGEIECGEEVVIVGCEKGIAQVRRWADVNSNGG
jgi:membrane protein implicated in regulation of membrane protease activity